MSVLNREHNVLFIHVPKTAGTSMELCHFLGGGGHQTIRDFECPAGTLRFAFVRNPWDRFVSAYFCQQGKEENSISDFNEFIYKECSDGEYPVRGIYIDHFRPQNYFLIDSNGRLDLDFIGKYETLQQDWKFICEKVGVAKSLPHYRKGKHPEYKKCYTKDSWKIIGDLYSKDVALFDYADEGYYQ